MKSIIPQSVCVLFCESSNVFQWFDSIENSNLNTNHHWLTSRISLYSWEKRAVLIATWIQKSSIFQATFVSKIVFCYIIITTSVNNEIKTGFNNQIRIFSQNAPIIKKCVHHIRLRISVIVIYRYQPVHIKRECVTIQSFD